MQSDPLGRPASVAGRVLWPDVPEAAGYPLGAAAAAAQALVETYRAWPLAHKQGSPRRFPSKVFQFDGEQRKIASDASARSFPQLSASRRVARVRRWGRSSSMIQISQHE